MAQVITNLVVFNEVFATRAAAAVARLDEGRRGSIDDPPGNRAIAAAPTIRLDREKNALWSSRCGHTTLSVEKRNDCDVGDHRPRSIRPYACRSSIVGSSGISIGECSSFSRSSVRSFVRSCVRSLPNGGIGKERLNRRFLISPYGFHSTPWAGRAPRRVRRRAASLRLSLSLLSSSSATSCSSSPSRPPYAVDVFRGRYIRTSVQRRVIILTSLKSSSSSSALPGSGVMRNTSREVTAAAATASVRFSSLLLLLLLSLSAFFPPPISLRTVVSSSHRQIVRPLRTIIYNRAR